MAKKKNLNKIKTPPAAKLTGVEFYFDKFAASHQNPANKNIHTVFVPLLLFGLFGLIWALPFPYIKFLGQYNQDFNWSSFLIAIIIYYYLKLSPILSYMMLFILLAFSFIVSQLQQWQKAGGPPMWLVCGVIFIIACIALYTGYKKEGKKLSFEYRYKNLLIAPLFLTAQVFRKFSIRY